MKRWRCLAALVVCRLLFAACADSPKQDPICGCPNGTVHTNAPCDCDAAEYDCTCAYEPAVPPPVLCDCTETEHDEACTCEGEDCACTIKQTPLPPSGSECECTETGHDEACDCNGDDCACTVTQPPTPPALTGTVGFSGVMEVGETVTIMVSNTNGTGAATYQWTRRLGSGTAASIANAVNQTYTIVAGDAGYTLGATVSYADQSGAITGMASTTVAAKPDPCDCDDSKFIYYDTQCDCAKDSCACTPTVYTMFNGNIPVYIYSGVTDKDSALEILNTRFGDRGSQYQVIVANNIQKIIIIPETNNSNINNTENGKYVVELGENATNARIDGQIINPIVNNPLVTKAMPKSTTKMAT